jgi:hypothetical protein
MEEKEYLDSPFNMKEDIQALVNGQQGLLEAMIEYHQFLCTFRERCGHLHPRSPLFRGGHLRKICEEERERRVERGRYLSKILGNFGGLVRLGSLQFEAVDSLEQLRLLLQERVHLALARLCSLFRACDDPCSLLLVPCCEEKERGRKISGEERRLMWKSRIRSEMYPLILGIEHQNLPWSWDFVFFLFRVVL